MRQPRASLQKNKGRRGRPPTGRHEEEYDPVSAIRLSVELREKIDSWSTRQGDPPKSRSDAIRRLLEQALANEKPRRGDHKLSAAKAKEIAEAKIAPLIDPNLPEEERQKRKRRLLKGPSEFREIRTDLPKLASALPKTDAGGWRSEDDATLVQLLEGGKELSEIALQMKRTLSAVRRRAKDLRARGAFRTDRPKAKH